MQPVFVFSLPYNSRGRIYGPGEGPAFPGEGPYLAGTGNYVDLPIPMPTHMTIWTHDDTVVAAWVDGGQVRWKDLDTVVKGITQYNEDCCRRSESEE